MSIISEKKEELQDVQTAKFITSMLRDISAIKMRSIRNNFKKNDMFFSEIRRLYNLVKFHEFKEKQRTKKESIKNESGVTLFVAITSDKRFFGSLNTEVMDEFLKNIGSKNGDYLVIGKTGKHYVRGTDNENKCKFMSFKDDNPTPEEMQIFTDRIKPYGKVMIFYPKFITVFKQGVRVADISQKPDMEELSKDDEGYIFEPDLKEVINFFETQIRHLLFNRTMLETELARTAARLMRMNEAESRATELIEEKQRELQKEISSLSSLRLLETFVGFKRWEI